MGISRGRLQMEIERQVARGDRRVAEEIDLTPRAKRVIAIADDESQKLGNKYIGTEHLLLGLIREGEGLAGRVLHKLGATLEKARALTAQYHTENPPSDDANGSDTVEDTAQSPTQKNKGNTAMWQRFTERSRRVVFFAQEEAGRLGENFVSPLHLLLGLVRESDSVAARILSGLGVDLGHIRSEVERQVATGEGQSGQDMQLTPDAKRVIDYAYEEARKLDNNYIGTEHLLLGLIRQGEGISADVLKQAGVEYYATVVAVKELQASKENDKEEQRHQAPSNVRPKPGDLGTAHSPVGQDYIEVAHDAATFVELGNVFLAKDAHGYRSLLQGDQTMFIIPVGTPIKLLVAPAEGELAKDRGGRFVRVLAGDFVGYSGWIFADAFVRTGSDEAPFPPPLGD